MKVEELKDIKKFIILISVLMVSLIFLSLNRSQSYYKFERIQFESSGAILNANLYYPSNDLTFQQKAPLLIYAHGIGGQSDFDLRIPIEFTKRGFYVAAIDYQGHGNSGGNINNINPVTNRPALAEDCSKLLDAIILLPMYASNINSSQIGLIGHSLGGMVVLMNGVYDDRFKAMVCWAPLVDPEKKDMFLEPEFKNFYPKNIINATNTQNLLIITHVNDEALNYSEHAVVAQQLTGCTLITVTEPLLGGGHMLYSDQVLIDSINWFELNFFNSKAVNGPISISYWMNYILIFISMLILFLVTLSLISYSIKFFINEETLKKAAADTPKTYVAPIKKMQNVAKIILAIAIFVATWDIFFLFFGFMGLLYASLVILLIYVLLKVNKYYYVIKLKGLKKYVKEQVKKEFNRNHLAFALVSTGYFIGTYLIFSYFYPFAFVFPANILYFLMAFTAYPVYLSLEILYRKIIYPKLNFIKSEKNKSKVIVLLAIIIHVMLMAYTSMWAFFPSVLMTYMIFLVMIIFNTVIFEKSEIFAPLVVTSFIIIMILFGGVISNTLGIGSVLHVFV